jgi:MurNAc alpha-1-phosphate uridylyltransferase
MIAPEIAPEIVPKSTPKCALILAAGRGERMRPLTDATPKPLLKAGGRRLIEWQIAALVRAGARHLVINTAHLPSQFEAALGDGSRYGARIRYAREGETAAQALETLGGIVNALPLLGPQPFILVSGDIVTDYDYRRLAEPARRIAAGHLDAHLVLVDNPAFHPDGDMGVVEGCASLEAPHLTYANNGVFAPRLFDGERAERKRLFPWLYRFFGQRRIGAEAWHGQWANVGTPEDLHRLDAELPTWKWLSAPNSRDDDR